MQKKSETMQSWEKTKVQCLVRNAHSGVYYARARVSGKLVWKSLKTDLFAVAKARLQKALADTRKAHVALEGGYATFGEAAKIYLSNVARKVDLKPRSVDYQREVVQALLKSWPELGPAKMNAISSRKCLEWASGTR
jgi:hypothetical protein